MRPSVIARHPDGGNQAEVVAFLSDPASYPARPERVERFETHGTLVFLAGDEAWKIKRAVRFPYMDLSMLELRKAACEREVEVNRRGSPAPRSMRSYTARRASWWRPATPPSSKRSLLTRKNGQPSRRWLRSLAPPSRASGLRLRRSL